MSKITTSTQWKQLEEKAAREDSSKIKELFSRDPNRAEKFSIENGKLFLDYSKNPIDAETFQYLVSLVKTSHLEEQKLALFSGKKLNVPRIGQRCTQRFGNPTNSEACPLRL